MAQEEEAFNIWSAIADKELSRMWNTSIMDDVAKDRWLNARETNFETIPKDVQQYVPALTKQFKEGGSGSSVTQHLDSGRLVVQRTHNSIRRKGGEKPLVRFFPKADAFHQKQVDRMNFWGNVFNAPAMAAPFLAPALARNKGFTNIVLQHGNKKVPIRLGSQTGRNYWQQRRHRKLENQLQKVEKDLAGKDAFNVTNLKDSFNYPFSKGQVSTTPVKAQIPKNTSALSVRTHTQRAGLAGPEGETLQRFNPQEAAAMGLGQPLAMAKNPKKLSKKDVAKNAKIETENALTLDATGKIKRSVHPELDFLSKLPEAEQVRRITTQIKAQHESQQLGEKSELLTSAQSLGTGKKVFMESPETKLAAGLKLEAPGILKKFGYAWNSAVQQAHHWFQKGFTGPFMQHMVKLARDPKSPITFYDVANIEAAIQSTGIPGIGHSGVGGIIESIHNWSHKTDRKLGREPTGGMPLSDAEMTSAQLKAEKAKQRKIFEHYKKTGEDIETFYPGPSLGVLLKEAFKLKTADELTQYVINIANDIYVPQMKRMQKLNEAAEDDLPEFSANVEMSRLRRDDTKAIIRGAKPNTLGLTKEQLKARKDKESFEYQEARVAQRESAIKIDEGRDITEARKADLARENLIQGYEPGTPEYEYLEWIHLDESKRIRWRTGGGTQSFGRVK